MRGKSVGAVLVVAAFALVGCGRPDGVDGNLTNNWAAMPNPGPPAVGACYDMIVPTPAYLLTAYRLGQAIPCDGPHDTETIYIGQFSGAVADRETPPDERDDDAAQAYVQCAKAASDYLGEDWHQGRVELLLDLPLERAWTDGRRYFRCDLIEQQSNAGKVIRRTGRLRDGLRGTRPLAYGCGQRIDPTASGGYDDLKTASCTDPHDLEYVGTVQMPDGVYPEPGSTSTATAARLCEERVAAFIGISAATLDGRRDIDWSIWWFSRESWALGDRTAECFLSVDRPVRISLRGFGNAPLPA
jgi:hypothetical protein